MMRPALVLAALLWGAASLGLPSAATASPSATSPAAASGACTGASGVTVVVDFGAFGGGVQVGCAAGDPASGYQALVGAGFAPEGAVRSPSFLCRIDGLPTPAADPCIMPPPATAYWSYWIADRGKSWCYSNTGMYGRNPVPGTVEGWSFVRGSGAGATAAPRSSTFTPVTGAGTTGADCDRATTATTAPPTTAAPRTTTPAANNPRAPQPPASTGSSGAGAGTGGDGGGAVANPSPGGAQVTAPPGSSQDAATTSTPNGEDSGGDGVADARDDDVAAGEGEPADAATEGPEQAAGEPSEDRDAGADPSEEAASTVALAQSGRSGPGGPVGTLAAVGTVAAVAGAAFVVNRRRFALVANPSTDAD